MNYERFISFYIERNNITCFNICNGRCKPREIECGELKGCQEKDINCRKNDYIFLLHFLYIYLKRSFWRFFLISKIWICNTQRWINEIAVVYHFAGNFKLLHFLIIFTVSIITAVGNDHGVMTTIPSIST